MAWNVEFLEDFNDPVTTNYTHYTRSLDWGIFQVVPCKSTNGKTTITVDFLGTTGSLTEGWATAYVCQNLSDFMNSDEVPENYLGQAVSGVSSVTVTVRNGNNFYVVIRPVNSSQSMTWNRVSIEFSGGSVDEPYFTAVGDSAAGTIDIDISNYSSLSYSTFTYYIRSSDWSYVDQFSTAAHYKTITGLSDGTYIIQVTYTYNGNEYNISFSGGGTEATITLSGGGGGTTPTYQVRVSNDTVYIDIYNTGSNWEIYTYLYNSAQEVIDHSSRDYYSGLEDGIYYIEVDYKDDDTGWIHLQNDSTGATRTEFQIGGGPVTYPTYTYSVNANRITFNVQNRGNYYLSYIARLANDSDDRTYTLYYTTNTQVTTTELLWNTSYSINVGYSETINGNITWIGSNLVTIDNNPSSGYVYIYDGSRWRKAKPYVYDGSRWKAATAYVYDGSQWRETTE